MRSLKTVLHTLLACLRPLSILYLIIFLGFTSSSPVLLAQTHRPTILVFGNSLSAGYGIEKSQGWVSLLEKSLEEEKLNYQIVNASVSGETTVGGLHRLPALLKTHAPKVVILELGGNDGLRGLPLTRIRNNLEKMIKLAQRRDAKVLLLGIYLPPNYGPDYTQQFQSIYLDLSKDHDTALVPFLLEGVALNRDLMQRDGFHPTAQAQPLILNNVLPALLSLIKEKK